MSITGSYQDGTPVKLCPIGDLLFDEWIKSTWDETTPERGDIFDNPEGRAYWAHRETCPDCTKRKGMNDGKS